MTTSVPLTLEQASLVLLNVQRQETVFATECKEQQKQYVTELKGINAVFETLLQATPHIKLASGKYLYFKQSHSARAVNEDRIRQAVENLSLTQIRDMARSNQDLKTPTAQITAALCNNLESECIALTQRPHLAARRPINIPTTTAWRTADATTESTVQRYMELQARSKMLRVHQQNGRKRCHAMQTAAEPVLLEFMANKHKQVVQWVGSDAASEVQSTLPPLPLFTGLPGAEQVMATETAGQPLVFPTNEPCLSEIQIQKRVYTSRGKAPGLTAFTEALVPVVSSVVVQTKALTEAELKVIKTNLVDSLLQTFRVMFEAQHGKTTEKLKIRAL